MLHLFLKILISLASGQEMFVCTTQSPRWKATVTITSLGPTTFKITHLSSGREHICSFKPTALDDLRAAVMPSYAFEFEIDHCDVRPRELLTEPRLLVPMADQRLIGEPRLHWLKNEQPESCKVKTANAFELDMAAKRAKANKWPARTSASPKKTK